MRNKKISPVRSTLETERRFERAFLWVLRPNGKHDFRLRQPCPPQKEQSCSVVHDNENNSIQQPRQQMRVTA